MKSTKFQKRLFNFVTSMVFSAVLCITSPGFAQLPYLTKPTIIAQYQSSLSIEQQARSHYESGDFSQAARLFGQAIQEYQSSSNPIREALSLSNLSLCYQQLGEWNNARDSITRAINLLKDINNPQANTNLDLAQAFDIQGSLQLARGQTNLALESWKSATDIYTQLNKPLLVLATATNQAQALQNLGLYRRAITLLEEALKLPADSTNNISQLKTVLTKIPTSPETATALHILGDSLRVVGKFSEARLVLQRSLDVAKQQNLPEIVTLAQLGLGNTARAQLTQGNKSDAVNSEAAQRALKFYREAAKSNSQNLKILSQVNQISLFIDIKQTDAAKKLIPQIKQQIDSLPPTRSAVEARLHLANAMMEISKEEDGRAHV